VSDGNYGGNGSVYWEVVHTDGPVGPKQKLKKKNGPGTHPKNDHWLDETNGETHIGRHPIDSAVIGEKGDGTFQVRMRFSIMPNGAAAPVGPGMAMVKGQMVNLQAEMDRRKDEIRKELLAVRGRVDAALNQLNDPNARDVTLEVNVLAINRLTPPAGAPEDPWEVNVHW
jgi:hypothetical protein